MELFKSPRQKLDPLDLEFDSDEGLEAILRRELIEIVCSNGVTDAETSRDLVLATLSPVSAEP
jgi:hypothetical protein